MLHATIAVSAWLVLRRPRPENRGAMVWWSLQLAFNLVWSPLFFGARQYGLGFADICLLLVALAATVVAFGRLHRPAALLLVPYLCWVAFAAALNLAIWIAGTS
ncbi:TspO/MBR family protein [Streptomyces sp. NPDC001970]